MPKSAKSALHEAWGANLRRIREDHRPHLSQRALAKAVRDLGVNLHHGGVALLEQGGYEPSDTVRIGIARALGVQVSDLFPYPDTGARDAEGYARLVAEQDLAAEAHRRRRDAYRDRCQEIHGVDLDVADCVARYGDLAAADCAARPVDLAAAS